MAPSLKRVWSLLESTTAKDRHDGVEMLRITFGVKRNLLHIAQHNKAAREEGKTDLFLRTITAIIQCVNNDKQAAFRKNNRWQDAAPQSLSRLRESANALRWLVEQANTHFSQQCLQTLLMHIITLLNDRGALFEPIALDYTKALSALLSYPPHVQHISADLWSHLVALCFNALLGVKLSVPLDTDIDDDQWRQDSYLPKTESSTSRNGLAPRKEAGPEVLSLTSSVCCLVTSKSAPLLSEKRGVGVLYKLAAFFELFPSPTSAHAEALRSVNATLLDLQLNERKATMAFVDRLWPTIVSYLPTRLKPLKEQVLTFAVIALPIMSSPFLGALNNDITNVDLEARKIKLLKQLHRVLIAESQNRGGVDVLSLEALELVIAKDPERDSKASAGNAALHMQTLRPARSWTAQNTLSWASLQLLADATAHLTRLMAQNVLVEVGEDGEAMEVGDLPGPSSVKLGKRAVRQGESDRMSPLKRSPSASIASPQRTPRKRRRGNNGVTAPISVAETLANSSSSYDALNAILDELEVKAGDNISTTEDRRSWALQSLTFLAEIHWSSLDAIARKDILNALLAQLDMPIDRAQSHLFLAIGACAVAEGQQQGSAPTDVHPDFWYQVWIETLRKVAVPLTSRAAAHAASAMLYRNAPLLNSQKMLASLKGFLQNLDTEAPSVFADSTCALMRETLRHAAGDVLLAQAGLEFRVLDWINRSWSSLSGSSRRSKMQYGFEALDAVDLAMLLIRVCRIKEQGSLVRPDPVLDNSDLLDCLRTMRQLQTARDYLFEAKFPAPRSTRPDEETQKAQQISPPPKAQAAQYALIPIQRRCYDILLQSATDLLAQIAPGQVDGLPYDPTIDSPLTTISIEDSLRLLHFGATALIFDSSLKIAGVRTPNTLNPIADQLFIQLVRILRENRWVTTEKLLLLQALRPLLPPPSPPLSEQGIEWISQALTQPGHQSGVSRELFPSAAHRHVLPPARILPSLWGSKTMDTAKVLAVLQASLSDLTTATVQRGSSGEGEKLASFDDEEDTPMEESPQIEEAACLPMEMKLAFEGGVALCVEAISILPFFGNLDGDRAPEAWLVDRLLQVPDAFFTPLATCILDALAAGRLPISSHEANSILQRLGSSILASYEYGRVPEVQILGASFIRATKNLWLTGFAGVEDDDFAGNVVDFFSFFTGQASRIRSWRVRLHLIELFDKYLADDLAQEAWAEMENSSVLPLGALINFGSDPDFAVRFAAARAHALLVERLEDSPSDVQMVYTSIRDTMVTVSDHIEPTATFLLCTANVAISSSVCRGLAIASIMELTWDTKRYRFLVQNTLKQVASSLGFESAKELYRNFASNVTYEFLKVEADPFNVDVEMLGYASREEYARHLLSEVGSTMLLYPKPTGLTHFASLVFLSETDEGLALAACFTRVAAHRLLWAVQDVAKETKLEDLYSRAWNAARDQLALDMRVKSAEINDLLHHHLNDVISAVLKMFYNPDALESTDSFLEEMDGVDSACAQFLAHLQDLGKGPNPHRWRMHEPYGRHANGIAVYHALATISVALSVEDDSTPQTYTEPEVYNPLHLLLETIFQDRFVNDQLRHLDALKLWIAFNYDAILDSPILHRTVLHGASLTMQKEELATSAIGMVYWCLNLARETVKPTNQLGEDLLFAAKAAFRYSQSRDEVDLQRFGDRLMDDLEKIALNLSQTPAAEQTTARAICTWPRRLGDNLAAIVKDVKLDDTRLALLQMRGLGVEAHHLEPVTAKLQAQDSGRAEREHFAQNDFWHLLVMIGESQERMSSDPDKAQSAAALGDSIANLIHALDGRIRGPSLKALNDLSDLTVLENPNPKVAMDAHATCERGCSKLKEYIVSRLLRDLRAIDSQTMASAYHMLRRLKVADPNPERFRARWENSGSAELQAIAPAADVEAGIPENSTMRPFPKPKSASNYDTWVTSLAQALLSTLSLSMDDAFLHQALEVVARDVRLSAELVPIATMVLLLGRSSGKIPDAPVFQLSQHYEMVLQDDNAAEQSWSTIIKCLLNIRANANYANGVGFPFDLLLIAQRSLQCKLYSTALMLVELSLEPVQEQSQTGRRNGRESAHNTPRAFDPKVSELLHQIYANIDDPDGFYGIPIPDVQDAYARQLQHEGEWRRALDVHATRFEADLQLRGRTGAPEGLGQVTNALHQLSYNGLASTLRQSAVIQSQARLDGDEFGAMGQDLSFEVAWRMGEWDLPIEGVSEELFPGHGLWSALRALSRETDAMAADHSITATAAKEVAKLQNLGLESYVSARDLCRNILSFREVRLVRQHVLGATPGQLAAHLREQWSYLGSIDFDYSDFERICTVRHAIIRLERDRLQSEQIGDLADAALKEVLDLETSVLLQNSKASRENGNLQKAMGAVTLARKIRTFVPADRHDFAAREEQASVFWDENSHSTALQALNQCLSGPTPSAKSEQQAMRKQRALALAKLGTWTATARAESAQTIDLSYFTAAMETLKHAGTESKEMGAVTFQYAVFADAQYRHFATSPEHHRARRFVERRTEEIALNELEQQRTRDKSQKDALKVHKRKTSHKLAADKAQLLKFEENCALFLSKALSMYATSLRFSEEHDEAVFPFSSLWFENSADAKANEHLAEFLKLIPSHKFIPLAHQLSARLTPGTSASQAQAFTNNLTSLLQRMCSDHPYHTLYAIFALKKAGWDSQAAFRNNSSPSPSVSSQAARARAADAIWSKVKSISRISTRMQEFERVCGFYVQWAELSLKEAMPEKQTPNGFQKGSHKLPSNVSLLRLRNADVPVATKPLPVDISGQYQHFVKIVRYSEMFSTAGGLHLPKINECIGTDGRRYKQLFKHEDDLRQDAVIQQVFSLVNNLLAKDRRTRTRRLTVRGYIVLPLGPQCGLLEFVANTKPLGEVLTGLHDKYRIGNDLTANDAKQALQRARGHIEAGPRIKTYKEVCENFPPAMRYHFLEAQKVPAAWQVMRLSYVRSVATTSIVGHILGMGDRHVSNILMDEGSGEIVHIDFGIVFEQGKFLPIPELVPFRLTRDLVDGMGIFGVEGSFRRCCQETLRVMRDGADTIKTVLEVFKYDPLFEWMTNPIKLLKAQANQDDETNNTDILRHSAIGGGNLSTATTSGGPAGSGQQDTAELSADYAVSTVMGKLSNVLSVEHTVNDLIQQARNMDFLGAIYFGWSAHL
ncbi:unnamed protein product [Tilletia laevis]|uniref:Serine/threonine-protein kinase Tel1 n=1 Tax=Tilletia laevis TaxID=157183 RepID=A0A9N8LMF2_9BASI|nr:hypothetical protein CF336_g5578 [Tilletia laevis]CAD6915051.1 unnamed protein product [Tilletia laevis]CAD6965549.1 unnamed protein product [Tilletia laevis]